MKSTSGASLCWLSWWSLVQSAVNRKEAKTSNREKALELLDTAEGREHEGGGPSNTELISCALVLILADISERLEGIESTLNTIEGHIDGQWQE